jgi:hypothetical protein
MTLTQLLSSPLPPLIELRVLWLVFNASLNAAIIEAQDENARMRVEPIILTDGRLALCADILTETEGVYAAPFSRLNPANFSLVDVIDAAAFQALQPQDSEP